MKKNMKNFVITQNIDQSVFLSIKGKHNTGLINQQIYGSVHVYVTYTISTLAFYFRIVPVTDIGMRI